MRCSCRCKTPTYPAEVALKTTPTWLPTRCEQLSTGISMRCACISPNTALLCICCCGGSTVGGSPRKVARAAFPCSPFLSCESLLVTLARLLLACVRLQLALPCVLPCAMLDILLKCVQPCVLSCVFTLCCPARAPLRTLAFYFGLNTVTLCISNLCALCTHRTSNVPSIVCCKRLFSPIPQID